MDSVPRMCFLPAMYWGSGRKLAFRFLFCWLLLLYLPFPKENGGVLAVEQPHPGELLLTGILQGKSATLRLKRVTHPGYLLTTRGFHWVNEFPMNR